MHHGWDSCHERWGYDDHHHHHHHRRYGYRGSALSGIAVIAAPLITVAAFTMMSLPEELIEQRRNYAIGVVIAMIVVTFVALKLVVGYFSPAKREAKTEEETGATADVAGLRIAIDAAIAPSLVAQLARALRGPEEVRIRDVSDVLLTYRSHWRLAGLDATQPLPEAKAKKLFDAWASDARKRFAPRPADASDPYRESGLLVVCLHVETRSEVADVDPKSPTAVEQTLGALQRISPGAVRMVDFWSSSGPMTLTQLREVDRTLVAV